MNEILAALGDYKLLPVVVACVAAGAKGYALWQKRTQQVAGETLTGAIEPLNHAIASIQQTVKELSDYRDGQRSFFEQVGRDVNEALTASRRAEAVANETRGYTAAVQAQLSLHMNRVPHSHSQNGAGYGEP